MCYYYGLKKKKKPHWENRTSEKCGLCFCVGAFLFLNPSTSSYVNWPWSWTLWAEWTQRWSYCGCGRQCQQRWQTKLFHAHQTDYSRSLPPALPWPCQWNCWQKRSVICINTCIASADVVCLLLVGCLTSQQHASVSQGRICTDRFTCCHTEIEAADQTFYLTQSQYTDTGPTSPSAYPIMLGAWQGSQWSANF